MHIVLENHYAHTDFNPQVSGSNDTRRALVSDTAFVGNTYTCTSLYCYCSVWEYGLCNDIEISYRDGGGKNEVALNNFNVKLIYYDTIKFIML